MDGIRNIGFQQVTPGAGQVKPKEAENQQVSDQVSLGGDKTVPEGVHKKWLFMNYVAADCNLKEYQAANIDNQEIVGSDANTHVVAMIDIGPNNTPKGILDWSGGRTYYVTQDSQLGKINSPVVEEYGDHINMVDTKTLTKFIVDMMQKFPSDHVALIMNDHGGGWVGAMSDDTDGKGKDFSMPDMKNALAEAEKITGKKIDIFGFDACLMADTQAAYEFKDVANFYLAAEETEGGPGWSYNSMLDGHLEPKSVSSQMSSAMRLLQDAMNKKINVSPEEFCKIVVKVNEENQKYIPTFSAIDLTKMDIVKDATNGLAEAILKTDEKEAVRNAIMNAQNYGGGWAPYNDMHDLGHLAKLIDKGVSDPALKKAAEGVKKAIEQAVIANEVSPKYSESTGLHIYAPSGGMGADYQELAFAKDTQWDEAIKSLPAGKESGQAGNMEDFGVEFFNNAEEFLGPVWPDGTSRKTDRK
ncbi:MAG TPA: clostripain-related cysteine peptidase [Candidatus Eremiobacteraeota bacterium]|nr:clostripain-related cysteine peptidase [Candidatus Eremiobacteraeota bacterium]